MEYISLSSLQEEVSERIGYLEEWVRVEIASCKMSGGHWYFDLIEKSESGEIAAQARGMIWRSNAAIVKRFVSESGEQLRAGLCVVMLVSVSYHPRYGLSLTIEDIDASFTVGQRELERQNTIRKLTESGLADRQKKLQLPLLPRRIALISSETAAGYGDFGKHMSENPFGYRFIIDLFPAAVQGDGAAAAIASRIGEICIAGGYDVILLLRGGGGDSDLFCFDEYELAEAIAMSSVPVLTAIGHERDFHVADMVAYEHFKTPTALADFIIDWVSEVESEIDRCLSNIKMALTYRLNAMDNQVALLEASIKASDPRSILAQGYVLAADSRGRILRSASSACKGDGFSLRFSDGRWQCEVKDVKL